MVRRPTRLGGGACALTHVAIAMDTVAASAAARWMRRRAAAIALGQACFESAAVSMLRRPPPRPSTAGFAALVDALTTDPARSSDSGSESVPPPAAVSVHDAPRPAASRTRQLTLGSGSGEDEFTESVCGPRCSKQRGVGSPNDGAAKFTSPDNICWRKKSSKKEAAVVRCKSAEGRADAAAAPAPFVGVWGRQRLALVSPKRAAAAQAKTCKLDEPPPLAASFSRHRHGTGPSQPRQPQTECHRSTTALRRRAAAPRSTAGAAQSVLPP